MIHTRLRNRHLQSRRLVTFAAVVVFGLSALGLRTAGKGIDAIHADELRQRLTYFAGPEFRGRGDGAPELRKAAEYIAAVFRENGVKPDAEDGSYFQPFDLFAPRLAEDNSLSISGASAGGLRVGSDYIPYMQSANGTVTASLIFSGYGLNDPALGYAQPTGLRGKIAVVLDGFPDSDNPKSPLNAPSVNDVVSIDAKANDLAAAGAVGLIVIQNPAWNLSFDVGTLAYAFQPNSDLQQTWMFLDGDRTAPGIPVIVVSSAEGRRLIPDLPAIRRRLDTTAQNIALPLDREATMKVQIERHKYSMQNVVGIIEGSDPSLKAEKIVIGAHYDHLGAEDGAIWYGADDDGSGDVALMALAEAFGNGNPPPRRSIVLAAWAGEEKGEFGSRHFVQSPLADHTVTMLQMDMIGRNEDHDAKPSLGVPLENAATNVKSLNVIGSIFSPELKSIVSRENTGGALTLRYRYDWGGEDLERRSDHWNFLEHRIPAVFFFSGIHPDYHTPHDTPDKINYTKIENVAKLVYRTATEIANEVVPPHFVDPK